MLLKRMICMRYTFDQIAEFAFMSASKPSYRHDTDRRDVIDLAMNGDPAIRYRLMGREFIERDNGRIYKIRSEKYLL